MFVLNAGARTKFFFVSSEMAKTIWFSWSYEFKISDFKNYFYSGSIYFLKLWIIKYEVILRLIKIKIMIIEIIYFLPQVLDYNL